MYCCIHLDASGTTVRLRATTHRILGLMLKAPGAEVLRTRRQAVIAVLMGQLPPLQRDVREQLYFALGDVVAQLDDWDQGVDMAIQMALCHHGLPAAQKAQREQAIEALIQEYFGPLGDQPTLAPRLKMLRSRAPLLPDALMEMEVRGLCGPLWLELASLPGFMAAFPQANGQMQQIWRASGLPGHGDENAKSVFQALLDIGGMLPPDRRTAFVDCITDPAHRTLLPGLEQLHRLLADSLPRVPMAVINAAIADLLPDTARDAGSPDALNSEEITEAHVALISSRMDHIDDQMMRATITALDSGVDMGTFGRVTAVSLATMRTLHQRANARLSVARLRQAQAVAPTKARATVGEDTDIDPVQAWSVARLVRWIEGPLTRRSPTGRLDRRGVLARERHNNAGAGQGPQPQPEVPEVPEMTEDDVGLVIQDALAGTARFFHDELQEMTQLASRLGANAVLITRCTALLQPLQALASQPAAVGEEDARGLLEQAEDLGTELRHSLRATEARTLQARRFEARLHTALSTEPLVLGKRHGGVIPCALQASDWPWVAARFHRRWLSLAGSLVVDGAAVPLRPDQALALYVTGSSLSAYAFDISVHLWQRRAGCTSAPGAGPDAFAPMNGQDWFDTYITCCVLHVPQAG